MQRCCESFGIWKAILALALACLLLLIFLHEGLLGAHRLWGHVLSVVPVFVYSRLCTITCTNCHGAVYWRVLGFLILLSTKQPLYVTLKVLKGGPIASFNACQSG